MKTHLAADPSKTTTRCHYGARCDRRVAATMVGPIDFDNLASDERCRVCASLRAEDRAATKERLNAAAAKAAQLLTVIPNDEQAHALSVELEAARAAAAAEGEVPELPPSVFDSSESGQLEFWQRFGNETWVSTRSMARIEDGLCALSVVTQILANDAWHAMSADDTDSGYKPIGGFYRGGLLRAQDIILNSLHSTVERVFSECDRRMQERG